MFCFLRFLAAQVMALLALGLSHKAYYTVGVGASAGVWILAGVCLAVAILLFWFDSLKVKERRYGVHTVVAVFFSLITLVRDMPPNEFINVAMWVVAAAYLLFAVVEVFFKKYTISRKE